MYQNNGTMVTELFEFIGENNNIMTELVNEGKVMLCEHCGGFKIRKIDQSISLLAKQGEKTVPIGTVNVWLKPGHKLLIGDQELVVAIK